MADRKKVAFWSVYIGFCIVMTLAIGAQGAFDGIDFTGSLIVLAMYLVSGFFINLYIEKNSEEVKKWFEK